MLKQHTTKSHPSFTTTGCLSKATCMFAIGGHPNLAAHSSLIHPVMVGLAPREPAVSVAVTREQVRLFTVIHSFEVA